LFHEALLRTAAQRDSFVREACDGDADLHREVLSLLEQHDLAGHSDWVAVAAAQLIDPPVLPQPGQALGPYRIESFLAAGGMGEVFRAIDTRLDRHVAIKISAARFSEQFDSEARIIASLNHPYICQLYDVGPNYLVMELVEGPTLADRIRRGALPVTEALELGRQIAEALEAAHEKSRIHRDLKPSNVKVTAEGTVKLLDFGLAKAAEPTSADKAVSTDAGVVLGTAAYMTSEQARGSAVDTRTDIWSFGVVLMEMLTGRTVFGGETAADTMAAVINNEPNFASLPTDTPAAVRQLLRRCLEKDRRRRLQAIGEARIVIEDVLAGGPAEEPIRRGAPFPWAVAFVCLAIALTVIFVRFKPASVTLRPVHFTIAPPNQTEFAEPSPAISPDGARLAFTAQSNGRPVLWVQPLDSQTPQPLPGTEGASQPFWSPDSRFIGFFADQKIKKVDISGRLTVICEFPTSPRGGTWNQDDVILFNSGTYPIFRVSAAGGIPTPVVESPEWWIGAPSFLPDGRHFLYLLHARSAELGVYVGALDSAATTAPTPDSVRPLISTPVRAVFAPSPAGQNGYLLFMRGAMLIAQAFDPDRQQLLGEPHSIAELGVPSDVGLMRGPFSASTNGVLVYQRPAIAESKLVWFDRSGKDLGVLDSVDYLSHPSISPDGKRVVWQRPDPKSGRWDVWLHDIARGASSRFTTEAWMNDFPVWSSDGRYVFFSARAGRSRRIIRKLSSGAGEDEPVFESATTGSAAPIGTTSVNDRALIYADRDKAMKWRLWVLPLDGEGQARPLLQTAFNETHGQFSPDGKWFAYTSDKSGHDEVYMQRFPPSDELWQVSTSGGSQPRRRRDGRELFYLSRDGALTAVSIRAGKALDIDRPKPLFQTHGPTSRNLGYTYDVTADGQRFLINTHVVASGSSSPIHVILNWTTGLK
jgi:Tol biopolymer transport system component/tRNA A-37 threonylcarbamoyl transferase component Bud32